MPPAPKRARRPAAKAAAPPKAANLFLYVGTDEGRVREAALQRVRALSGGSTDDLATETVDGTAENTDDAVQIVGRTIEALQTLPFFGGTKVVWLKGANFLGDSITGNSKGTQAAVERLLEILGSGLPPDVCFVLSATAIDKRRRFFLTLSKVATVEAFDKPDISRSGWEEAVQDSVRALGEQRGLRFSPESLELFVMRVGESSMQIETELEKLDLYLGAERKVQPRDVQQVVSLTRSGVVFEIGNAIGRGDLSAALELVDHLLHRGETAIGILLAAIVPQVRRMVQARDLLDRVRIPARSYPAFQQAVARLPEEEREAFPRTKEGAPSVYPVFLAARDAERCSREQLLTALEACLEANLRLVTSGLDPRLVLHQLLIRILAPAAPHAGKRPR